MSNMVRRKKYINTQNSSYLLNSANLNVTQGITKGIFGLKNRSISVIEHLANSLGLTRLASGTRNVLMLLSFNWPWRLKFRSKRKEKNVTRRRGFVAYIKTNLKLLKGLKGFEIGLWMTNVTAVHESSTINSFVTFVSLIYTEHC